MHEEGLVAVRPVAPAGKALAREGPITATMPTALARARVAARRRSQRSAASFLYGRRPKPAPLHRQEQDPVRRADGRNLGASATSKGEMPLALGWGKKFPIVRRGNLWALR